MKKTLAILVVALMLCSMLVPVSAADEKVNVMANAMPGIAWGMVNSPAFERMWDGNTVYDSSTKTAYCDFKYAATKAAPLAEDYPKVNVYGDEGKEDSIYYCTFEVMLDAVYNVDTLVLFTQGFGSTACLDGFDIWVGVNGKDDYKKVYSVSELVCGSKYENSVADGFETAKFTAEFDATDAKFLVFGLTGYRCQHTEALTLLGLTPNENINYFRITELELYGYATEQAATTPAETTPAETTPVETTPVETTPAPAPAETTPAPAEKGGCGSVMVLGLIPAVAVAVVAVKKRK